MGRVAAKHAEVAWRVDDAVPEVPRPEAVDDDACRQWILWVDNPARQLETPARICRKRRTSNHALKYGGNRAGNWFTRWLGVIAAIVNRCFVDLRLFHHKCQRKLGGLRPLMRIARRSGCVPLNSFGRFRSQRGGCV